MEQLTFKSFDTQETSEIYTAMQKELNNGDYIKFLVVKTNKDQTISIKAKSVLCAKIKLTQIVRYIEIRAETAECFKDYINKENTQLLTVNEKTDEEKGDWLRIQIKTIEDVLALTKPICAVYMLAISEFGGESFGCCSRYLQCSNEKKCVQPDYFLSLACTYKRHLEEGKIFYGENRNV